jgi:hypothetical protein
MYYGEKLNSISHLVGAVLALVGLGALLTIGIQTRDPWIITSFTVFGLTMVLLYTMSTLYHSFHPVKLKRIFKLFDHIAIYLLIAGTYTPFMLVSLRDILPWAGPAHLTMPVSRRRYLSLEYNCLLLEAWLIAWAWFSTYWINCKSWITPTASGISLF